MMEKEILCYIDGVDWQHELGEARGGNTLYPSLKDLKRWNPCWDSCGVVKVKVISLEWMEKQDISRGDSISSKDAEKREKELLIEIYERRLEKFLEKTDQVKQKLIELKQRLKYQCPNCKGYSESEALGCANPNCPNMPCCGKPGGECQCQ